MAGNDLKTRSDMGRLISDLQTAKVELLIAECAADRLRLHYSLRDIAAFGERETLRRAIASARALNQFFSEIEAEFPAEQRAGRE